MRFTSRARHRGSNHHGREEHVCRRTEIDRSVRDTPVRQILEETVEVVHVIPIVEEIVNMPVVGQHQAPAVQDAERYPDEDESNKAKIEAKHGLED